MNRRIGWLIVRTTRVFEDLEYADQYLKTPNRLLNGMTPLEAVHTTEGLEKVERQLRWFAGAQTRRLENGAELPLSTSSIRRQELPVA